MPLPTTTTTFKVQGNVYGPTLEALIHAADDEAAQFAGATPGLTWTTAISGIGVTTGQTGPILAATLTITYTYTPPA